MFDITLKKIEKWESAKEIDRLAKAVSNKDIGIACAAMKALGRIGGDIAFNTMLTYLRSQDASVRATSAGVLGDMGDSRALEHLRHMLDDKDAGVRESVEQALKKIGNRKSK